MHRPSVLLCAATLGLSGLVAVTPATATAAPAPQASAASAAAPADELVVGYAAGATPAEHSRARGRASASFAERVVAASADRTEVELVRLPQGKDRDQAVAELQSDPAVAYAEPNWTYSVQGKPTAGGKPVAGGTATPDYFTNGSLFGMYGDASAPANQYGSQAAEAWARGSVGSQAVYVGVIDEGIQFTHPDLAANVWTNPGDSTFNGVDDDGNGFVDDVHGWDFAGNDSSVYDGGTRGSLDDHGTHVSGTIGAVRENATPTTAVPTAAAPQTGVVGVNQNVTLISGKFLGSTGGALVDAVRAVDYFTDLKTKQGLNIVATNNSWGGGGFSQTLLDAITRANTASILFVAAAGNSGTDNDVTASYPSNYDVANVIAVAAIDSSGGLASFSQYGARTVDLGAPGVGVWSTTAFNGYSSYSGTSMATPHVTGAAALYASTHPGASAATIKAAILGSVAPTPSLAGKTVTGGRLNVSLF